VFCRVTRVGPAFDPLHECYAVALEGWTRLYDQGTDRHADEHMYIHFPSTRFVGCLLFCLYVC
jgi:hypothetical protein